MEQLSMRHSLDLELAAGHELLTVATIVVDEHGEYHMRATNITGASTKLTLEQQARALRILATGIEAEHVFAGPAGVAQ